MEERKKMKKKRKKKEMIREEKERKNFNEFCLKVITNGMKSVPKFQNGPASEGGISPLRHPPVRASAHSALTYNCPLG